MLSNFNLKEFENIRSSAGTGIHGYGYYDTHTRPVNIRLSKLPISTDSWYPFLIFVSYPLRVFSADIRRYGFFLTSLIARLVKGGILKKL